MQIFLSEIVMQKSSNMRYVQIYTLPLTQNHDAKIK